MEREKLTNADGTFHEGIFKDGKIWEGQGTIQYVNGDSYSGGYKNGKRHGVGKYTYTDGSFSEGIF